MLRCFKVLTGLTKGEYVVGVRGTIFVIDSKGNYRDVQKSYVINGSFDAENLPESGSMDLDLYSFWCLIQDPEWRVLMDDATLVVREFMATDKGICFKNSYSNPISLLSVDPKEISDAVVDSYMQGFEKVNSLYPKGIFIVNDKIEGSDGAPPSSKLVEFKRFANIHDAKGESVKSGGIMGILQNERAVVNLYNPDVITALQLEYPDVYTGNVINNLRFYCDVLERSVKKYSAGVYATKILMGEVNSYWEAFRSRRSELGSWYCDIRKLPDAIKRFILTPMFDSLRDRYCSVYGLLDSEVKPMTISGYPDKIDRKLLSSVKNVITVRVK